MMRFGMLVDGRGAAVEGGVEVVVVVVVVVAAAVALPGEVVRSERADTSAREVTPSVANLLTVTVGGVGSTIADMLLGGVLRCSATVKINKF